MIVIGKEDIMVSHLSSLWYICFYSEIVETPFQALKVVSVVAVQPTEKQPKSEPSMAYWKGDKAIMENWNVEGWGKVIELREKKDQFRVGYQPSLGKRDIQASKGQILLVQENFTSALHIFGGHVAMIDEIAYNEATSEWIRQGAPGEELNN